MASTWRPEFDVILSDSEDEEEEFKRDFHGREALLFVIDSNLYADPERFVEALEIIRKALISGLLVSSKDLVGLVFANTEMSPDPFEPNCLDSIVVPQNCAVFLPLRQLTVSITQHFLKFFDTAKDTFGQQYGVADNGGRGSFAAMIRLCLNLFENCSYSLNNASLVFMTDRETPHPPQSHEYQRAIQKAKDLEGKEIEFKVIPMLDDFNYDIFYKEFQALVRNVELDSFVKPDAQQLREILSDRKLKQDFLNRSLGHFHLSLAPNLEISVQYYSYFKLRKMPKKVKLLRKNNAKVDEKYVIIARKQDPETMEITEEHEVKTTEGWYEIHLGDMPIRISAGQMVRMRNLHKPGMMILGFKSKLSLPNNFCYLPSTFMYPDEKSIIGSKRLFFALWASCKDRNKVAICLFMRRRKSIPRYVALVPVAADDVSDESSGTLRSLLTGDGFKIVYLPMSKHIRDIDFNEWNTTQRAASDEGVEHFQKIIKKLRIEYQPNLINDNEIELLKSNLLALALNIKSDNAGVTELPDPSTQDERIAKLLPKFEDIFGIDDAKPSKKRSAKDVAENNAKKVKITDDDLRRADYVKQLIENKTLSTCTVAQLRSILLDHYDAQPPKSATKQLLIDRIYDLNQA